MTGLRCVLCGRVYPHGYTWAVWLIFGACIVVSYAFLLVKRHRSVAQWHAEVDSR